MADKKKQNRKAQQAWASKNAATKPTTSEAPDTQSETLEDANSKLAAHSKVVSMKEEKMKKEKKARKTDLPALPSLPKMRSAKVRPDKPCECGCGGTTKARFVPGHDSYQRAVVLRVVRKLMTMDEVKALGLPDAQIAAIEAKVKEAKKEAREAAKHEAASNE